MAKLEDITLFHLIDEWWGNLATYEKCQVYLKWNDKVGEDSLK